MNKSRRVEIQRAVALIAEAQMILRGCADEEREYFDNMPESLQGSEKGQQADHVATLLEEAASALEDIDVSDAAN